MTDFGRRTAADFSKFSGKRPFGLRVPLIVGMFFTPQKRTKTQKRDLVKVLLLLLMPCLISLVWLVIQNIKAEAKSLNWETHTRVVKQRLRELISSLQDAESGQRGFIITASPSFLEPYYVSRETSELHLTDLRRLTADNPEQQQRLADLTPLIAQKFTDLKVAIGLREGKGFPAASDAVLMLSDKKIMDQIRVLIDQTQAEEAQLLQVRMSVQTQSTRNTTQSIFMAGTLGTLALFLLFVYLRWEQVSHHETKTAQHVSEDQYRSLFNSINEGFCTIDVMFDANGKPIDYCFLEVNPAFERQTGLHKVIGKRIREIVPDVEEDWLAIYGKVALTGVAHRFVQKAEAMGRWFDVYVFRPDGLGCPKVAILFTDITEQHQARIDILRLNAELEDRVERRTTQLQAANRELEAFSYSVSHDLRSPLKTIGGFTHLLARMMEQTQGSKGAHYLSRIQFGVQQMGELIDGLLSLAKMSRETLHCGSVDLSAIARQAARDCREQDPGRQVQIDIQDGMEVYGDARLLSVVIQNLLGNAWKFTSWQEAACIEIGCQMEQAGKIIYFFKDNGAGFDMAHIDKLFSTFERLHAVSDFSGTGIGLATVKRVIEWHGGCVWAKGKVNEGATFYFTLQPEVKLGV